MLHEINTIPDAVNKIKNVRLDSIWALMGRPSTIIMLSKHIKKASPNDLLEFS